MTLKTIKAGVLSIAYEAHGPAGGWPCILGHGFPYDPNAYAEAGPLLVEAGALVIVPCLRGFGSTRFLSPETPRSGEQAALGADLLALMDALQVEQAVLGGYDWGHARPALSQRFGLGGSSPSSPAIRTTSRISYGRWSRRRRPRKRRSGISTTFTANAAAGD